SDQGIRTVLPTSRPATASSCTAGSSVSGSRAATSIRRSPASTRRTRSVSWAASLRTNTRTVATPRPASSGPGVVVLTKAPPSGAGPDGRGGLSRAVPHRAQPHADLPPGPRLQDRGGGVVHDRVRAVGAQPGGAPRAAGRGHRGTGLPGQLDGEPADRAA